ncbi:hypothetical protein DSO57_1019170 [Entomophthora muscae]|uniref:Uncharacterized protein n=1 Tax=Entomophthora muscae TaxID=34485 RepID=A0ACC2RV65_9FUNG|nr:hypothetical protein DSO57_1019170 [Entomophthora muscae]
MDSSFNIKSLILNYYKHLYKRIDSSFQFSLVSEIDLNLPVEERFNLSNLDSFVSFLQNNDESPLKVFISWSFYQDFSQNAPCLVPIPEFSLERLDDQLLGPNKTVDLLKDWLDQKLYLQPSQLYSVLEKIRRHLQHGYFSSLLVGGYVRVQDEMALWDTNPNMTFSHISPETFIFTNFLIISTPEIPLSDGVISELKFQIKVEFCYEKHDNLKTVTSHVLFPPEALEIFSSSELGSIYTRENTREFTNRIQQEIKEILQSYIYHQNLINLTLYSFAARFSNNLLEVGFRSITFYMELNVPNWNQQPGQKSPIESANHTVIKKTVVHISFPSGFPKSGLNIKLYYSGLPNISKSDRILTSPCPTTISSMQKFADQVTDIAVQAIFSELTHPFL